MMTSRAPNRSRSRFTTGIIASAIRRAVPIAGASPARSTPSRIGTSPESVVKVLAPISAWPDRTSRTSSVPLRLRSAWLETVLSIRPPLRSRIMSRR